MYNQQNNYNGRSINNASYNGYNNQRNYRPQCYEVFVDGACRNNGYESAKAGLGAYWGENHPLNVAQRLNGKQTNSRAELVAATVAIEQAIDNNLQPLILNTDSQYVYDCMVKYVQSWKENGWRLYDGSPVQNQQDIAYLDMLRNQIQVEWRHVRAHSGIHGNEEADRLANWAIDNC